MPKDQDQVLNSTLRAQPFTKPFVTRNANGGWEGGGRRIKATILNTKGSHNVHKTAVSRESESQPRETRHTHTHTYTKSPGDHVQNDIIGL